MRASFDDNDFSRAVAASVDVGALRQGLASAGLDWDYLSWVAVGLAEEVLLDVVSPVDAGVGADAFTAGFLIGTQLVAPSALDLSRAVDVVRERGRHALIADFCDLSATARFEMAYAESLAESVGLPSSRDVSEPLGRLFESGLATAFALTAQSADAAESA